MARYADYIVDSFMRLVPSDSNTSFASFDELNDPTYLEFLVIPHFQSESGLLSEETNTNSALAYLKRTGETERYKLLVQFITQFKAIVDKSMWSFVSISGIAEALKLKSNEPLKVDRKLDFEMIETIDWRLQSLISLYKSIAYDFEDRHCEVLPSNLRHFYLTIYVRDIRILINDAEGRNHRDFGRTVDHLDVELTACNHRMFHFGKCEIAVDESGTKPFETLTTKDYPEATIDFTVNYKTFAESAVFRTILGDVEISSKARNVPKSWLQSQADIASTGIDKIGQKTGIDLSYAFRPFESSARTIENTINKANNPQRIKQRALDSASQGLGIASEGLVANATQSVQNLKSKPLRNVYSDTEFFRNLDAQIGRVLGTTQTFNPNLL